jgi:hypothetical protein
LWIARIEPAMLIYAWHLHGWVAISLGLVGDVLWAVLRMILRDQVKAEPTMST